MSQSKNYIEEHLKKWLWMICSIVLLSGCVDNSIQEQKALPEGVEWLQRDGSDYKLFLGEDESLVISYLGASHAGTAMTYPLGVEIDGEMYNISLMYFNQTIANSPSRSLLKK